MNGSAIEKNIVFWVFGFLGFWDFGILGFWDFGILGFWDFAKLAEIDAENLSSDTAFNTQFADATLVHLNSLKDMNQPGEIKSRLDYVRYAFPYLMKDERISSFF